MPVKCILIVRAGKDVMQRSFMHTEAMPTTVAAVRAMLQANDLRLETVPFSFVVSSSSPAGSGTAAMPLHKDAEVEAFFARVSPEDGEVTFDIAITSDAEVSQNLTSMYLDDDIVTLLIFPTLAGDTSAETGSGSTPVAGRHPADASAGLVVADVVEKTFIIPLTGVVAALQRAVANTLKNENAFMDYAPRVLLFHIADRASPPVPITDDKSARQLLQEHAKAGTSVKLTFSIAPTPAASLSTSRRTSAASPRGQPATPSSSASARAPTVKVPLSPSRRSPTPPLAISPTATANVRLRLSESASSGEVAFTFPYEKKERDLLERFCKVCAERVAGEESLRTVSPQAAAAAVTTTKVDVVVTVGGADHALTNDGELREWMALAKESRQPLRVVLRAAVNAPSQLAATALSSQQQRDPPPTPTRNNLTTTPLVVKTEVTSTTVMKKLPPPPLQLPRASAKEVYRHPPPAAAATGAAIAEPITVEEEATPKTVSVPSSPSTAPQPECGNGLSATGQCLSPSTPSPATEEAVQNDTSSPSPVAVNPSSTHAASIGATALGPKDPSPPASESSIAAASRAAGGGASSTNTDNNNSAPPTVPAEMTAIEVVMPKVHGFFRRTTPVSSRTTTPRGRSTHSAAAAAATGTTNTPKADASSEASVRKGIEDADRSKGCRDGGAATGGGAGDQSSSAEGGGGGGTTEATTTTAHSSSSSSSNSGHDAGLAESVAATKEPLGDEVEVKGRGLLNDADVSPTLGTSADAQDTYRESDPPPSVHTTASPSGARQPEDAAADPRPPTSPRTAVAFPPLSAAVDFYQVYARLVHPAHEGNGGEALLLFAPRNEQESVLDAVKAAASLVFGLRAPLSLRFREVSRDGSGVSSYDSEESMAQLHDSLSHSALSASLLEVCVAEEIAGCMEEQQQQQRRASSPNTPPPPAAAEPALTRFSRRLYAANAATACGGQQVPCCWQDVKALLSDSGSAPPLDETAVCEEDFVKHFAAVFAAQPRRTMNRVAAAVAKEDKLKTMLGVAAFSSSVACGEAALRAEMHDALDGLTAQSVEAFLGEAASNPSCAATHRVLCSVVGAFLAPVPCPSYLSWLCDHFKGKLSGILFAKMRAFQSTGARTSALPIDVLYACCWEVVRFGVRPSSAEERASVVEPRLARWCAAAVQLECLARHIAFPPVPPYDAVSDAPREVRAGLFAIASSMLSPTAVQPSPRFWHRPPPHGSHRDDSPAPQQPTAGGTESVSRGSGTAHKEKRHGKVQYRYRYQCGSSGDAPPSLPADRQEKNPTDAVHR